jgi:alcohol dehydrogenase
MLVPVPTGVDPLSVASLSDNIPDGWRTVGPQLEAEPGASVLIVGGTSISLYAAAIAVALGASRVDFIGGGQRALEIAEALGAHAIEGPFPRRRLGPYPITVAATPDSSGLELAIRSTAPDGVCTSCGIYFQGKVALPLFQMYSNGIRFVTGRVHACAVMPQVLELVRDGRLRPELVTAQVIRWEEAAEALAEHHTKTVVSRSRRDEPNAVGGV